MSIDPIKYREDLSNNFIQLLDSKRGVASNLAKAIGKPPGFINEVRRGKPVNAFHIKAVSIVFGPQQVLELLAIDDIYGSPESAFKDKARGKDLTQRLIDLEKMSPKAFDMVATYITGAHEAAKATADNWEKIEKEDNKKKVGFQREKSGTSE
jgi:hypothetical protein